MHGIENLHNSGIQFIGNEEKLDENYKTLIVVGIARGGTSLVSGTLAHLGVCTGDKSSAPVYEDLRLSNAFESNDIKNAEKIISEYDEKHTIWAFKRPAAINYLDKLNTLCRNPIYLFIFKDIFAVSNRNSISMKSNLQTGLLNAQNDYSKVIKFISKKQLNGFLFSYEKVMSNREDFIDVLVDLIGEENVTLEQKNSAFNFIEPNPEAYLNASRITRGIGQIGKVEKSRIIGWGKYIASNEIAEVELYINNKLVARTKAKDFRQHILDEKIHPTGYCGYVFNLVEPLSIGDIVSVKLSEDVQFLRNSNQVFTQKE